ncbi:MAG: hypothetical protein A2649_00045 [Candidatus Yanofskybacteria bacterium RIFCSPHIGHO2_01_FULL_41_26]|uniref:Uncharacterized protein n=1 Tax=Candidatus Yanofskybacteria bacterium RIFCSPHIGHO2_01_FULL_41_26 TaxID=1802661 RepID=A0A1F8EDA5_9BACT|nr:MAG: hypothetical protein A2649_00045 [Candidatus Yanofskybacteria bacterium RIFCSPHIGHO2_01_FULL_41_26]
MSRFCIAIALSIDWHIVLGRYQFLKSEEFMLLTLAVPLVLLVTSGPLVNSPPDVKNFNVVLSKELEFRVNDCKTGFLGRVVDYQNPNDTNEFVRVYYRQVAIVSERACENKSVEEGGLDRNFSNLKYHNQQEAKVLGRVQQATDAFAYVQWRTVRDPRTGQDIREDFLRSWLLDQNGNCALSYGYDLSTSPFSEPSKADSKKQIIVGIKFTLAGQVHIVRIDQDDIATSKEATNEKK